MPFRDGKLCRIPQHVGSADTIEPDVRVIRLDQAQHSVTDEEPGTRAPSEDVEHRLGILARPSRIRIESVKDDRRTHAVLVRSVPEVRDIAHAVGESVEVATEVVREVQSTSKRVECRIGR